MGVLGIIAEYNPFHNGHLYHLENSKKYTNSDVSIAIISGNFCERGNTSVVDKWVKTKMALANGIDLVIELPIIYSISSAENFADGAIKILNSLGVVDYISFGAETTNIAIMNDIASVLSNSPSRFVSYLKQELKKGVSFPKAREEAILQYFNYDSKYENILSQPNNILGLEYLKSLQKHNSKIKPLLIKREGTDYNSLAVSSNFASSTAIRKLLIENHPNLENGVPPSTLKILKREIKDGHTVFDLSKFSQTIIYLLRKMDLSEIANIPDVTEGLENSLKTASFSCNNIYDLLDQVKSKRYTYTRLQRILLYLLLGITKKDIEISTKINPYVRILGFNQKGKNVLSQICGNNPKLNVITSVRKFMDSTKDKNLKMMLEKDILATNIYTLRI